MGLITIWHNLFSSAFSGFTKMLTAIKLPSKPLVAGSSPVVHFGERSSVGRATLNASCLKKIINNIKNYVQSHQEVL